jgi:hypothetical protein
MARSSGDGETPSVTQDDFGEALARLAGKTHAGVA